MRQLPAAFGRLCVETTAIFRTLKLCWLQPPSGGCVLKLHSGFVVIGQSAQPPSGGCVLKPPYIYCSPLSVAPAAFGRLCVETVGKPLKFARMLQPPSGGCVLKPSGLQDAKFLVLQPPSGGCVLKLQLCR